MHQVGKFLARLYIALLKNWLKIYLNYLQTLPEPKKVWKTAAFNGFENTKYNLVLYRNLCSHSLKDAATINHYFTTYCSAAKTKYMADLIQPSK